MVILAQQTTSTIGKAGRNTGKPASQFIETRQLPRIYRIISNLARYQMAHHIRNVQPIKRAAILNQPIGLITIKPKPRHASVKMQQGRQFHAGFISKKLPAAYLFKIIENRH